MNDKINKWTFIIDTDDYSGNFHREMSGYIVGHIDDGHGSKESATFMAECDEEMQDRISEILDFRSLEHDNCGYIAHNDICLTSSDKYQGVAIFLIERPSDDLLDFMMDRAKKFSARPKEKWSHHPGILGFRLIREETIFHEEWKRIDLYT